MVCSNELDKQIDSALCQWEGDRGEWGAYGFFTIENTEKI